MKVCKYQKMWLELQKSILETPEGLMRSLDKEKFLKTMNRIEMGILKGEGEDNDKLGKLK